MDNLQGQEHLMTIPSETITILLSGKHGSQCFHWEALLRVPPPSISFPSLSFSPPSHTHSSILSPPPTLSVFLSASSPSRRSSNPGIMNSQLSLAIPALPANTTLDEFAQLLAQLLPGSEDGGRKSKGEGKGERERYSRRKKKLLTYDRAPHGNQIYFPADFLNIQLLPFCSASRPSPRKFHPWVGAISSWRKVLLRPRNNQESVRKSYRKLLSSSLSPSCKF